MLGCCLSQTVPLVLQAREELMPFILCKACLHSELTDRNQLLHTLFNLIKRPDHKQTMLMSCVAPAHHIGPISVADKHHHRDGKRSVTISKKMTICGSILWSSGALPSYASWTTEHGSVQSHLLSTLNRPENLLQEEQSRGGLAAHKLHVSSPKYL